MPYARDITKFITATEPEVGLPLLALQRSKSIIRVILLVLCLLFIFIGIIILSVCTYTTTGSIFVVLCLILRGGGFFLIYTDISLTT
uniref:PEP84R n=1 Tax=African swine fever virus TaxID=10497 RepID=A0A6G7KU92_ASF